MIKHGSIAIGLYTLAGVMVIVVTGYCFNVEVITASIRQSAASNWVVSQWFSPIDLDTIPPELPADHYLDRDLAVHNIIPGSPAPVEMVLLTDEQYKIAQELYLPNYVPERKRQRLLRELWAIYVSGGFGYPNVTETIDRAN